MAEALAEEDPAADLAIFAGTVPLLNGEFRHGNDWRLALRFGEEVYILEGSFTDLELGETFTATHDPPSGQLT